MIEKVYLDYEKMKKDVLEAAIKIGEEYDPQLIMAVSRGGISLAHIMAKVLHLDIGYIFPDELKSYSRKPLNEHERILVVDDLVAKGRTLQNIQGSLGIQKTTTHSLLFDGFVYYPMNVKVYTYMVDADYSGPMPDYYSTIAKNWLVFPWEEYDRVSIGDRGLFRNGTDAYK